MADARLVVQPDSVARSADSGRVTAGIWVSVESRAFPGSRWDDFAVVVLTWWVQALIRLLSSSTSEERIHFMDGPYFVMLRRIVPSRWGLDFVEDRRSGPVVQWSGHARPSTLVSSVIIGAEQILAACESRGWDGDEITDLSEAVRVLRAANLAVGD